MNCPTVGLNSGPLKNFDEKQTLLLLASQPRHFFPCPIILSSLPLKEALLYHSSMSSWLIYNHRLLLCCKLSLVADIVISCSVVVVALHSRLYNVLHASITAKHMSIIGPIHSGYMSLSCNQVECKIHFSSNRCRSSH